MFSSLLEYYSIWLNTAQKQIKVKFVTWMNRGKETFTHFAFFDAL